MYSYPNSQESNQFLQMKELSQKVRMGLGSEKVLEKYVQGVIINGYHSDVEVYRSSCLYASTVGVQYHYDFDFPMMAIIDEKNNHNIVINPLVLLEVVSSENQILFILAHEVKHILYRHLLKYNNLFTDEVNQVLINLATDAEVNTRLITEIAESKNISYQAAKHNYIPDVGCVDVESISAIVWDHDRDFRRNLERSSSYNRFGEGVVDSVKSIADATYVELDECCRDFLGKSISRILYDCSITGMNFKQEVWVCSVTGWSDLFNIPIDRKWSAQKFCTSLLDYLRFSLTAFISFGSGTDSSSGSSSGANGESEGDDGSSSGNSNKEQGDAEKSESEGNNNGTDEDDEGNSEENKGFAGSSKEGSEGDNSSSSGNSNKEQDDTEKSESNSRKGKRGKREPEEDKGFVGSSKEKSKEGKGDKRVKDAFESRSKRKSVSSTDVIDWYEVEDKLQDTEEAWEESCKTFGIRGRGIGSSRDGYKVGKHKSKSRVPWQAVLRDRLNSVSREHEGTKKRINRRQPERLELSGRKRKRALSIIVGVDESGSISNEEYSYFIEELYKILGEFECTLHLYEFTSSIESYTYVPSDKMRKFKKRKQELASVRFSGGTSFQPVFDAISENKKIEKGSVLVMLTDGEGEYSVDFKKQEERIWIVVGGRETLSCQEKKKNIYPIIKI